MLRKLYVQVMAPTFGKTGSRIISLSPSATDTLIAKRENEFGLGKKARISEMSSLGKMGRADEISYGITFFTSPAASYITSIDVLVAGGTILM